MNTRKLTKLALNAKGTLLLALLSLLTYLVLFGLNLASTNHQLAQLAKLNTVREAAANLRANLTRFVLDDVRLGSRRGMTAEQIKEIKRSAEESIPRLFGDLHKMEPYLANHSTDLANIELRLDRLQELSEQRAHLLNTIYDDGGLIADIITARNAADRVFTVVSEVVPLPTRDYLAAKAAQNEFLVSLSPAAAESTIEHLRLHKLAVGQFHELDEQQRRTLEATTDEYIGAFSRLSAELIRAEKLQDDIQFSWTELRPVIDGVSETVASQASDEARRVRERSNNVEITSAVVALLATLGFASIALSSYRLAKERDRRLRESNARFRDLALASSDVFMEVDELGRIQTLEGNQGTWTSELGADIVGKIFGEAMTAFGVGIGEINTLAGVFIARAPFRGIEYCLRHPVTGEERWHTISGLPVNDPSGAFAGYRCAIRNITAERQLMTERAVAESRLSAIVQNLPIALYRVEGTDKKSEFTFMSANSTRVVGLPPEELKRRWRGGEQWLAIPEDRGRFKNDIEAALMTEKTSVNRMRLQFLDDSIHWVQQFVQTARTANSEGGLGAVEGIWIDVTDEENRLQQLRDLEQSINTSDIAFYITDTTTRLVTYYSAGYARLFGLPLDSSPVGLKAGESGVPVGRTAADLSTEIDDAISIKGSWQGEFTWQLHSGTIFHFLAHARPLSETRRVVVLTEITARVAQEKQLQAISTAVENASDGVILFADDRGPIVYANDAVRRMFRLRDDTVIEGHYVADFMPTAGKIRQVRARAQAAMEHSDTWQDQITTLRADGTQVSILMRGTRLADRRVIVIMTDVTEQVRLEEEVKRRQNERNRLLANLPGVAYQVEKTAAGYVLQFISRRIEEISGYSREFLAEKLPRIIVREDEEARTRELEDARLNNRPYEATWRLHTREGDTRWILEQGEYYTLEDDRIVNEGHLTDITDRIRKEAEERELRRRLNDAQRLEAIGSLAGGIAHDFNNIIGAARGFADLLVADLPEGDTRHYAERIVATCRRATLLVREIMAFSRITEEEQHVINLANLVEDTKDILMGRAAQQVRLDVAMDADVYLVKGNASQLSQVITNILINASDATPAAGGTITFSARKMTTGESVSDGEWYALTRTTTSGRIAHILTQGSLGQAMSYVCLRIADEGTGMTERVLRQIFEPFFTTKEKNRGTGLGLAVVASIVNAHGGAVRVETVPGAGTAFEIFLPLSTERYEALPTLPARHDVSEVTNLRGAERILIVDDEVDIADSLSIALGRLGYETAPIYNSPEALEIFIEDPRAWDLVISDQAMPKMRGLQLIRKMRAAHPDLRTMICTGHSDALTPERAAAEGIDAFFNKPVTAETLAKAIRGLFSDVQPDPVRLN